MSGTNHLDAIPALANAYYAMRHGQSKANVAGIIVSQLATDASGDYGLSAQGREQSRAAALGCGLGRGTLICCSPFARARETAGIVAACLHAAPPEVGPALRERDFGDWEGTSDEHYSRVWAADAAGRAEHGAEPPGAVLQRVTALVAGLEARHAGRDILLVSHGDALQILQAGFAGTDPARHRDLPHLRTAEVRQLRRPAPGSDVAQ